MPTPKPNFTLPELIAPCGIDCRLCLAYPRDKKACPGCRGADTNKAKSCVTCRIKNCPKLADLGGTYCTGCDEFPCARLLHLDKRYRAKYATSPIANLRSIQENGIDSFVAHENQAWACPACGTMLCMHRPHCPACGTLWHN